MVLVLSVLLKHPGKLEEEALSPATLGILLLVSVVAPFSLEAMLRFHKVAG